MLQRLFAPMTVALLSGGLLTPCLSAQTEDLSPFTHFARVPVGADLASIRFEGVRLVRVPARIAHTTDSNYCRELASREPGGSIACPSAQTVATAAAYEAVYSYTGQPLASDEAAGRSLTFAVYFRPGELTSDMQKTLSAGNSTRAEQAAYFAVSTSQETVQRVVIDGRQSHICQRSVVDGAWIHAGAGCQDNIRYSAVRAPSGYITVKVDPASPRLGRTGIASMQ